MKLLHNLTARVLAFLLMIAGLGVLLGASAPEEGARRGPAPRAALFFEEAWKQIPGGGENPISQAHVANPALELKLYGPMIDQLQITGLEDSDANPVHTWSGLCGAGCVFAFRHNDYYADLSAPGARIMLQSKTSGFHEIRPFLKLADGTTLVGDLGIANTADFLIDEFAINGVRWMAFDTELGVSRGVLLDEVDLSRVDEIGFVDLQPGAGHGAGGWSDVASVRVYANQVPR